MNKILLIDNNNFIYRGITSFGSKPDINPEYTIVFNFFRNLRALIEQFEPNYIFFALEGHPAFRYELYADYKANRRIKTGIDKDQIQNKIDKKEHFNKSRDEILRLLKYLNVTQVYHPNFEADDIINTLCSNLQDEDITIISNDSDFIQILQQKHKDCKLYSAHKKEYINTPSYHYVAWKSLVGDKTDNIKKLISEKKSLQLLENPKLFETFLSVQENKENFTINRKLIEFQFVPSDELNFTKGENSFDLLKEEFMKMEFKSFFNNDYWERFCKTFKYLLC